MAASPTFHLMNLSCAYQASLNPNNESNKFIEAVISSNLEHLPENEPLRSWHINTDASLRFYAVLDDFGLNECLFIFNPKPKSTPVLERLYYLMTQSL
ncbi:26000_t:CDS:2 [Gigaspora margarita]|uniref:26000_t:CDS:1 n=1 Tax=Gigaspora margarita TaxID=4874 RepID=A0ABM8W4A2_GIGMA|nr:26000_t:CDS:2 [Gigaspora margarita]